jgi:hypothetical protein
MIKRVVKKSIVLGMIVLLIGLNIMPAMNGERIQRCMDPDKKDSGEKEFRQMIFSNPPGEEWNKTFGGPLDDAAYAVQQTTDGGYIMGGYTKSFGIALWTPWLIKTDSTGDELWNRTFTYYSLPFLSGYIQSVQQTNDGGYILGCSFFNITLQKPEGVLPFDGTKRGYQTLMVLIKTDSSGNEQWNRTYAGLEYSYCLCVRQTTDGGFIATGGGNATSDGSVNVYLLKTYPNGTMQWLRTYGTSDMTEEGHGVQQTSDGGYSITGLSDCNYYTDWGKIWLIKTDANGFITWDKKFEGTSRVGAETYGNSVQQTADSGFIIAGLLDNQGCLLKTDSNGNEMWRKTPFIDDVSFFCYSGTQTSDGGYLATGNGLIKTDALANEQWNVTIPFPFLSGQQTSDGGYVIAGSTSGYYNGDVWLIKFEPEEGTPDLTFSIVGIRGVNLKITNNGTTDATDISYKIHVEGGILGQINVTADNAIDIPAGDTITVGTGMFLGFGPISITVKVADEEQTATGTQLLIFSLVKK